MIEWINRVVLGEIGRLMQGARDNYGVDPIVFIVIYFASVPFFYFSIYRMVRALAKRKQQEIMVWSMVFLGATAAPFLYVLFFGRNLPWWVYVVIAGLIGQGVYSLIRKLRKKPQGDGTPTADEPPRQEETPGEK